MNRSRALIVVLLLGVVAPIGLGGLALPAHAREYSGDGQSADEGDQSATDTADNATDDQGHQGQAKPALDFSQLDVGDPPNPAAQTLQVYGTATTR